MACDSRPSGAPIDDEVMAFRLQEHGLVDGRLQGRVVGSGTQWLAQIDRVFLAEAHEQGAGACETDPVAAFAEVMRHRRDEAETAAGLGDAHVAGRSARSMRDILQRPAIQ